MAAPSPEPSGRRLERDLTLDRRKGITFNGKLFYLDLAHNKQSQLLTKAICRWGGVIESFLSRDVHYMVTGNKKAADITNGDCDKKENCSQRPATENIEECSSILSSARSWAFASSMWTVLEHLECLTQRRANRPTVGKGPGGAGRTLKVGKLKTPFLKIEDQSRKYRPIHCSFSNFPECSFISSDRSPFETARTHSTPKDRDPGDQDEGGKPQNWEKSGFCECCLMTYAKLSEHLISEQHCLFALNASNYRVIDDITSLIDCDFIPLPNGFKPSKERCEDKVPPQSLEESSLTEEKCLEKEGDRRGESKHLPMDVSVKCPIEEQNPVLWERRHVKPDAECPIETHSLCKDPAVDTMVVDLVQEAAGGLLVEDNRPLCTVSAENALVQCDLPLQAAEGSHVGLVTEVSWYTEEAGLTSVYTVQSLIIPPTHVLDQQPELAMEDALVQPSLLLSALGDPPYALAQGGFRGSDNDPMQGNIEPQIINAAPHQTNELLAAELQDKPAAGLYLEPSPAPATGSEFTLQHPDAASGTELPIVESAVDQNQQVLLLSTQNKSLMNTQCELPTQLTNNLSLDQLTLAPWHPSAEDNVTVTQNTTALGNLVEAQDPEAVVSIADCYGGKRKDCLSPCNPPSKRQPLHCQPMPMWVFHQLPSSLNQPTLPVFNDWLDKDGGNKAAENEDTTAPTFCFNPKMEEYDASSESDWDSQLVSQHHNNPPQTAHFGELRTTQVTMDESWYGKRLCSVLTHEQTLGSPSTTQTVTLSHASYDIYLSGVAT